MIKDALLLIFMIIMMYGLCIAILFCFVYAVGFIYSAAWLVIDDKHLLGSRGEYAANGFLIVLMCFVLAVVYAVAYVLYKIVMFVYEEIASYRARKLKELFEVVAQAHS